MLIAWTGGPSRWLDPGVFDRPGTTKTDRQYLDLYFVGLVIVPLLAGALLIALGLQRAAAGRALVERPRPSWGRNGSCSS